MDGNYSARHSKFGHLQLYGLDLLMAAATPAESHYLRVCLTDVRTRLCGLHRTLHGGKRGYQVSQVR